jgi:hypothetical protein
MISGHGATEVRRKARREQAVALRAALLNTQAGEPALAPVPALWEPVGHQ